MAAEISTSEIAGIVIGGIVFVAIVVAMVYMYVRKYNDEHAPPQRRPVEHVMVAQDV